MIAPLMIVYAWSMSARSSDDEDQRLVRATTAMTTAASASTMSTRVRISVRLASLTACRARFSDARAERSRDRRSSSSR